jgi:septal ring factor EnvC (AmiA/AmiB activator)
MTTEQPLALRLADYLDVTPRTGLAYSAKVQAAAELRRQHAEIEATDRQVEILTDTLSECSKANARLHAENEALRGFAQEVRRTGDTRLASMAIAALARAGEKERPS